MGARMPLDLVIIQLSLSTFTNQISGFVVLLYIQTFGRQISCGQPSLDSFSKSSLTFPQGILEGPAQSNRYDGTGANSKVACFDVCGPHRRNRLPPWKGEI
mmetsp:Transcript_15872/g.20989  ORF Transcript_15872/g.20989 Transcript_15872/m.20989 type:complete len:101 (-) Transcript_15872:1507-1809(-)